MPDWLPAAATICGGTVIPLGGLIFALFQHFHNRSAQARQEFHAKLNGRLDHLDDCVDQVKQRVSRVEGRMEWFGSATMIGRGD